MASTLWSATWNHLGRRRRVVVAAAMSVLVAACMMLVVVGFDGASADVAANVGVPVPADQLQTINAASESCPALTAPRLAGQLMANSGFKTAATRAGGRRGIAGLTDTAWHTWAPRPGAQRSSAQDNIVALAHQMCDFIGELRAADIGGDLWRLALASSVVGTHRVLLAGGVPTGAAADYVAQTEAYTNWYTHQRQFGGAGGATKSPALQLAPITAIPNAYVNLVLAAGSVCPAFTPARIAAQLMAGSGWNPNKLSPSGQEGIAQFWPQQWGQYNLEPSASPWDPAKAIPVLGRTMCDLASQVAATSPNTDTYAGALTAYEWGITSVAQAGGVPDEADRVLIAAVNTYAPKYGEDKRLDPHAPPTPSTRPPAQQPAQEPAQLVANQPAQPAAPAPKGQPDVRPATPTPVKKPTKKPARKPAAPAFPAPGTRSAYATIQAESYAAQSGARTESCQDHGGGRDVGYLTGGDWLRYSKIDFGGGGAVRMVARFASGLPSDMSASIQVRLDSVNSAPVGRLSVRNTGGWQDWITTSGSIRKVKGVHTVYLTFTISYGWEVGNINWISFRH